MAIPAVQHNTPSAGYISWAGFTIQIFGNSYTVAAGSTNQKWVWWKFNGGTPTIEAGATLPSTLVDDDLVLFANKSGIAFRVQSANLLDGELIVDGTILADAIAANQIDSAHIVTAGLDAGVIKFGLMSGDRISVNTLLGDRILANSIATSKLMIASIDNLFADPTFEIIEQGSTYAWGAPAGSAIVPAAGYSGGNALVMTNTGTAIQVSSYPLDIPVEGGASFRLLGRVKQTGIAIPANAVRLRMVFLDSAGATAATLNVTCPATAINTWVTFSGIVTAPANAVSYRAHLRSETVNNGGVTYWDYVQMTRAGNAELIVDGSIVARHIATDTITANEIATDTITANEIAVGAITASEIATNAITAIKVSADAILANAIKAGEIVTAHMLANTINGDRISANTLNASKIVAGSITTDRMTADSINGDRISAGTLDATKITANSITGDRITSTFLITSKTIKGGNIIGNSIQTGQTLNSGPRLEINEDAGGGFIKGFTAPAGGVDTAPVLINPRILNSGTARRQSLYLSSGAFGNGVASLDLVSGSVDGVTPTRAVVDANLIANQLAEFNGNAKVMSTNDFIIDRYVGGGGTTATINNSGAIIRTGSRRDLKDEIKVLTYDEAKKVLGMEAVSFKWKPGQKMGDFRQAGFIAEQTEEAGAELWLTRDKEGKASGVRYAEVTAAHNVIIKDQKREIEELKATVKRLVDKVNLK